MRTYGLTYVFGGESDGREYSTEVYLEHETTHEDYVGYIETWAGAELTKEQAQIILLLIVEMDFDEFIDREYRQDFYDYLHEKYKNEAWEER